VSSFQMPHKGAPPVPYILATYTGLWGWGLFSGALGGGTGSLIQNKVMMAKTHFPRECFPLSQVLESAFTSTVAMVLFFILFPVEHYAPKLATLWAPLYIAVELPFIVGVVLLMSSVVVQMRDLMNIMGMMTQFGMLATPVIWPLSKHVHGIWKPIYSFINPLAPVIDGLKNSILLGYRPDFGLLLVALCGGIFYFLTGYFVFKRLEVNFADLT
jgi:lipopolysaccharide transport system permease protein